ncbi:hypothetical protein EHI_050370 [Entamoeba histolytica HM-1:IMSS]|uniref:Haloacid dehalogenase-like hydrolase domain-containing protein n=6 Tax=Entamoeba histolytica TaxID=5759 RepID=C4LTR2_ENTH1|nr:hypothetical protein EHI_050370 [Entamoeba histolytica HM-1:IMSS]EAL51181.2 hypothetical protein EHI_050370 [Entamoeba histolytica HM-1:IMSS]EMD46279.1 haloacid dehalogenase hydrolase family protein, putative [Entamoeba histolytica KU27]ENY61360.1 haloacid dehalogenase family hydrolase domain containing protein [Entamoeba histolytica HM-1:IMSS-A]|eukprot:XP_656567.2 hypothetical protein EHI_050370 [Entamoeba histolytica HM-1:IMSS]
MKKYRPEDQIISLEEWYKVLWDHTTMQLLIDILKLTDEELEKISFEWRECYKKYKPIMFNGFWEFLEEFKRRGGIICICSHGLKQVIEDFYQSYNEGEIIPDSIYGYDSKHPEYCKPFTFPIEDILQKFHLQKKDIVVIDDLSYGLIMAKNSGVDSIGTVYGEGHDLIKPKITAISKKVVSSVEELKNYILLDESH